jgi:hypothetical protein
LEKANLDKGNQLQTGGEKMSYPAEISRANPTAILFLIDQSSSMADKMPGAKSKAQFVADALNRTLFELVLLCGREEGVRDYFHIGVLGYYENSIESGFQGEPLKSNDLNLISAIEASPLRVEDRQQAMDDGAGRIIEKPVKFPVWFEPKANGGTPMCRAITRAKEVLAGWCSKYENSYPPTVIHITDGAATDDGGNKKLPEQLAEELKKIGTKQGQILLFNLHVCEQLAEAVPYPSSDEKLPNEYSKMLFRMSSTLPPHILNYVKSRKSSVADGAHGFVYNADAAEIALFFEVGTRAEQLR